MFRILFMIVWSALSAWLLIWVGEGLFGVDQRTTILPFGGGDSIAAPIVIGTVWGLVLTFGGTLGGLTRRGRLRGETRIGVGRIVEISRTGLMINDVPQYDIFVRVSADDGHDFVSQLRMTLDAGMRGTLSVDQPLPVRYSMTDHDRLELADLADPIVRDALLDWRIQRGLIDPKLVRARRSGIQSPASVLEIRPTGVRREGQSELQLRVLVSPEGQQSWEADTRVFVYPEAISYLQVGSPVWARYLRGDPHLVAVTIEKEPDA